MKKNNAETEEELSEWVVIQTSSSSSSSIDSSTPPNSPILQPNYLPQNPSDNDDDEDSIVPVSVGEVEEEEEGEPSSTVNLSLPWRVIETAKKRLTLVWTVESVTRRRVFWSFTLVGGFFLVSSLVYVKLVRRLHEEKLRFLALLVREKDQKIKQLMLEIGRLNELLSSRRRVQVVRIV